MSDDSRNPIEDLELIVVKENTLANPTSGIVKIICTRSKKDNTIKPVDSLKYTDEIWISKNYEDIDKNYNDNELFVITEHYLQKESDRHDQAPGRHNHWAYGNKSKHLETNSMIPVILTKLPEKGNGVINLSPESISQSSIVFIQDEKNKQYIYGPFRVNKTGEGYTTTPDNPVILGLKSKHIAKVLLGDLEEKAVYVGNKNASTSYITGFIASLKQLKEKAKNSWKEVDYITDVQLIDLFGKYGFGAKASKNPIAKKAATQLKEEIKNAQQRNNAYSNNERLARLEKVLDQYLKHEDYGVKALDSYFSTSQGQEVLNGLSKDKPDMLKHLDDEYEDKKRDHDEAVKNLKGKIARKEKECKELIAQEEESAKIAIESIKNKTNEETQKELRERACDLENEIESKKERLRSLKEDVEKFITYDKQVNSIEELRKEQNFLEETKDRLKKAVDAQTQQLKSSKLPEELTELNTLLNILQGRSAQQTENKKKYQPSIMINNTISSDKGSELIQSICEKFDDTGRQFSFEETANLIISVQQSFLTVLKGLPGSGKTSTAIRMAKAYNLSDDDFLNVPVSRGWVSGRDFIGFYNSLKGNYQPAKTGMYQFLRDGEDSEASQSLRMILLDEANLSPIEHYWSDFIALCDKECRGRPIDTGALSDNRYLTIPENIRFMATINNDNTTEPLSPRLCDRATVISMDESLMLTDSEVQTLILDDAVHYTALQSLFGPPGDIEDAPQEITSFCDIMKRPDSNLGMPVITSQRKLNAMSAFYTTACKYMDATHAADFALSQHALPLISGYGEKFKTRLDELKKYTDDNKLIRTKSLLNSIVSNGDAYVDSYSFF